MWIPASSPTKYNNWETRLKPTKTKMKLEKRNQELNQQARIDIMPKVKIKVERKIERTNPRVLGII